MSAPLYPREGGREVEWQGSEASTDGSRKSRTSASGQAQFREKGRASSAPPISGARLRTVYDDTLRESVPDDFLDLLGKLS